MLCVMFDLIDQPLRRGESRSDGLLEVFQLGNRFTESPQFAHSQWAAQERREASSKHHSQVDHPTFWHDAILQALRGFVHQSQDNPIADVVAGQTLWNCRRFDGMAVFL